MGMNYYYHETEPKGRDPLKGALHLGKRSGGWRFLFRGDGAIRDAAFLRRYLKTCCIYDETGRSVSYDEFWQMVEARRDGRSHLPEWAGSGSETWADAEGFEFADAEFS